MKNAIFAVALGLTLAGCNNIHSYRKDGADIHRTQDDTLACQRQVNPHGLTGDDAKDAMDKCMADKGYTKQVEKYRL